jgi:hypothetical protein
MRYLGDIPHTQFKIGLYAWNQKYIVKIETSHYEQTFKVSEMDFMGTENDFKAIMADDIFVGQLITRFQLMHSDFQELLTRHDVI